MRTGRIAADRLLEPVGHVLELERQAEAHGQIFDGGAAGGPQRGMPPPRWSERTASVSARLASSRTWALVARMAAASASTLSLSSSSICGG